MLNVFVSSLELLNLLGDLLIMMSEHSFSIKQKFLFLVVNILVLIKVFLLRSLSDFNVCVGLFNFLFKLSDDLLIVCLLEVLISLL